MTTRIEILFLLDHFGISSVRKHLVRTLKEKMQEKMKMIWHIQQLQCFILKMFYILIFIANMAFLMSNFDDFDNDQTKLAQR